MKKIILSLFVCVGLAKGYAQVNADCIEAIPLCSNPSFTFYATSGVGNVIDLTTSSTISNPVNNPFPPNMGCLKSGELNPQWLLLTIGNAGMLEFVFGAGNSANPQVGCYDWAMWPYTPSTCSQIFNNTLAPVRCNWNATCQNGNGIASAANIASVGGNSGDFGTPLAVNACSQYMICISNYSGVNTLVAFQSLGTASLICNPNCNPNYEICAGQTTTIVPVNFAGLTNPTYSLNPGGVSNTTGSFVVSPVVTTTYVTYITGTNSANALQTTTAITTITVNPQPSIAPTVTQTSCTSTLNAISLNPSFNPSSPVPNYTVTWTAPAPNGVSSYSQTTITGGINPGTYTAVLTAPGGCSTSTIITINPLPAPSVFSLSPGGSAYTVTCAQPTIVLNGTEPGYSYNWTNGIVAPMTGSTTNYNTFSVGNWTVTGTNPVSGCTSIHTFTIFQNTTPPTSSVSPVNQNISCGVGVVATATGVALSPTTNVTHSWYSPGSPIPTNSGGQISIYTPVVGTNTFVLTNNINGCSTTKTIQVVSTGGAYPTFSLTSSQQFSIGCTTTATTNIVIAGGTSNNGGVVSYTVLYPGYLGGNTYTTGSVNIYTVNTPGNYTVIVRDNSNQCETRLPISIVQNTFAPNVLASTTTATLSCATPTMLLAGSSSNSALGPVTYNWAFQNGNNPGNVPSYSLTVSTNSAAVTNSIINNYTLTIKDLNNACINTTVVTMYQNTRPPLPYIATTSPSLTCNTPSVNLTNFSSTGIQPNTFTTFLPIVGLEWDGPTPQQPLFNNSTYLAYTAGTYTMIIMDMNNGCTSMTTTNITDSRVYPVLSTNTLIALDCGSSTNGGVKLAVTALGLPASAVTAQWFTPQPPPNISGANTLTLTTDGVGDYRVSVTTNSNGCSALATVKVTNGVLTADFTPDQTSGFAPLTVNFSNTSASSSSVSGTSSITSVWSFGNGTTRTTTTNITTSAVYTAPGTYTVTMFALKGSCRDTVVKIISVDIPSQLEVPNVFTPNGDGSNDLFFIHASNLSNVSAQIFDRWGNKVYDLSTDKGNIAWDGKNQAGKEVPAGTYFYTIKATGKDGQSYDTKGTVSLYR